MLAFFITVFSSFGSAHWDLNDVSFLMPLPESENSHVLLSAESAGLQGALLPAHLHADIPGLSFVHSREEERRLLRVVSVRIDPCFQVLSPLACQKQIRLIWQPVVTDSLAGGMKTIDAALHSFYVLDDLSFDLLVQDLKTWKHQYSIETSGLPLQIHPAWSGYPEASSLKAFLTLILKYTGENNLTRITAMVVRGANNMWMFAEYHVQQGQLQIQRIPRIDRSSQAYSNQTLAPMHFAKGGMTPAPAYEDNINHVVADTQMFEAHATEDIIVNEYRSSLAIQNPRKYSPATMDCASCHVAQNAMNWFRHRHARVGYDMAAGVEEYYNPRYDLTNISPNPANFLNIRGFGYYGKEPAISQRVINESAEVADSLNLYFAY